MIKLMPEEYLKLINAIKRGTGNAFSCSSKTEEPQLVANLVHEIPTALNNPALAGNLKGIKKISAGGVFVHSGLFVAYSDTSEKSKNPVVVEIGDILFVCNEVSNCEVINRRALLFQAKKAEYIPVPHPDKKQWYLYANWPEFTYKRGGSSEKLNGAPRRIVEHDMYDAVKYLLIYENGEIRWYDRLCLEPYIIESNAITAQPTCPELSRYQCFDREIANLIIGNAGKPFCYQPPADDKGWNRVICDIINITACHKSKYFKGRGDKRGQGDLCYITEFLSPYSIFGFLQAGNNFGGQPPGDVEIGEPNEGGGVSIIEITVEKD
jgi:hypothetical protein